VRETKHNRIGMGFLFQTPRRKSEATEFLTNVLVFDDRPLATTGERSLRGDKQL
jgi:hypothetical protein